MFTHEQVPVRVGEFTVDAGMADLVTALWDLGIETTNSCQGTDEHWRSAYLSMESAHFKRFLEMFEDDIEIAREARRRHLQIHEGESFVSCWHGDMRESFSATVHKGDGRWVVNIALRFPPSFVPVLTEIVCRRVAGRDVKRVRARNHET